jgi:phosphatidylglycerophosphate synthase
LPREYGGIIRGVGPGWTRVTRWGLVAIAIAALPLAAKSPLRGVRFVAIAGAAFIAQQLLVARGLAARDPGEPGDLDAIDALTLSRGLGAAMVLGAAVAGTRDRRSYAAKLAWPLALSGSTLTDWIDGPLARRRGRGPTKLGRVLDLELDSWLTLATTIAAHRFGRLHPACLATPSLRYLAMLTPIPYEDVHAAGKSERARNLGIAQMALALGSFAPFAGDLTTGLARMASLALVPVHVTALAARLRRGTANASGL